MSYYQRIRPFIGGSFSNEYSLNFDGSDENARRASWAGVQITGADEFFISFLLKVDSVAVTSELMACGSTTLSGALDSGWRLLQINQTLRWVITNSAGSRQQQVTTGNILTAGAWNHYVVRRVDNTGAGLEFYKDGASQSTTINTNTFNNSDVVTYSTFAMGIRIRTGVAALAFDGRIANPGVFNTAGTSSTPGELTTLKMGDLRTCSIGANLQGAWHFPNGTSDYPTWVDYSGGGHDLTMTNQESADISSDIPT